MQKNFQRYLEAIQYKITGGQEYGWNCYPNARYYDSETDLAEVNALVDAANDVVYEIHVSEAGYGDKAIFRWINPDYRDAYTAEAESRNVDPDKAYDDVAYCDTDSFDDIIAKTAAIAAGEEYDDRVVMHLDLPEDTLFLLFKEAHRLDITANQLFTQILEEAVDQAEALAAEKLATELERVRAEELAAHAARVAAVTDPDLTGYQGA